MNIILGERCSGKTEELIQMAAKDDSIYIAVCSKLEATRVFHYAKTKGFDIRFPITYDELITQEHRMYGMKFKVLIDDLQLFIRYVTKHTPVVGFSLNIDFIHDTVVGLNKTTLNAGEKDEV